MDFDLTTEQNLLRDNLRSLLLRNYRFEDRAAAIRSASGWRPEIWRQFSKLGLLGAALPERIGGSGGGAVETMIIMEEFGRALVIEPFMESMVCVAGLLARVGSELADRLAAEIIAGESLAAFAWSEPSSRYGFSRVATTATPAKGGWYLNGVKSMVVGAPWASVLLVSATIKGSGPALFIVDKQVDGLRTFDYPTIDGRYAADLHLDNVFLAGRGLIADAELALPLMERLGDDAVAAQSSEAVGLLRRMHQDTTDYTRQRSQFGQTLSSFQVIQHRLVDMYLQIEIAESASHLATLSLEDADTARAMAVSAAKFSTAGACRFVGQNAVQLHGGIGMTEELPLGSYFKRATVIESEFGSIDYHLARHARLERTLA